MAATPSRVVKEMGITHADFFRILPRVFPEQPYTVRGTRVVAQEGPRRLTIELSAEGERRVGPLITMPVTHVTLTFAGYGEAERARFLAHFELQYFRGGG